MELYLPIISGFQAAGLIRNFKAFTVKRSNDGGSEDWKSVVGRQVLLCKSHSYQKNRKVQYLNVGV